MKALLCMLAVIAFAQSAPGQLNCQEELIGECQEEQKRLYEAAHEISKEVYCQNSQALIDCISENGVSACKGKEISKYRYTNMEYNLMNRRTGLCPELRTEELKKLIPEDLLQEHKEVDEIERDERSPCAKEIHWACVQGLQSDLQDAQTTLCSAVNSFRNCYEQRSDKQACHSPLLVHFRHLLTHLNREVLSDVRCPDDSE